MNPQGRVGVWRIYEVIGWGEGKGRCGIHTDMQPYREIGLSGIEVWVWRVSVRLGW